MTVITQLPDPPSRTTPSQFSARTDAFLGALPGFVTETNAVASEVNADKIIAFDSAAIAVTKAAEASSSAAMAISVAGLTRWTSGQTYTEGASVYSPINSQAYRRVSTGAGTVDPSLDRVNWRLAIDDGITTLVLDKDREVQIYSNETNKQFSIMAPSKTPFLYSEDGVEWEMSDGLAKNLTGDAYVSGLKGLGVMSVVEPADVFWTGKNTGACFLNNYLFVATTTVLYQYSFPNGALINSVASPFGATAIANLISDGIDIIVLSAVNEINNQAVYAGGDLSSVPALSTRVYPYANVGRVSGFYDGDLYQYFYSGGLTGDYPCPIFNTDGTKYYWVSTSPLPTITFNLSVPYDLSTAKIDIATYSATPSGVGGIGGIVSSDGTKFYQFVSNTSSVNQYNISPAFNFSSITSTGETYNLGTETYTPPIFNPSGTKMYYLNQGSDTIRQVTLSTAWDLDTAGAYVEMSTVFNTNPYKLIFSDTGTVAYVYVTATQTGWHKVNLSVAWDITTATSAGLITTSVSWLTANHSYKYSNDGTKLYITGAGVCVGYELSTPWLLETAGTQQTFIPTIPYVDALVKYDGVSTTIIDACSIIANIVIEFPLLAAPIIYSGCINGVGNVIVNLSTYGAVVFGYGAESNLLTYPWKYAEAADELYIYSTAYNPDNNTIYSSCKDLLVSNQSSIVKFGGPSAVLIGEELI